MEGARLNCVINKIIFKLLCFDRTRTRTGRTAIESRAVIQNQHYRSPEIRVYSAASYFRRTLTGVKSALRQPHIQPRNMSTHAPRLRSPQATQHKGGHPRRSHLVAGPGVPSGERSRQLSGSNPSPRCPSRPPCFARRCSAAPACAMRRFAQMILKRPLSPSTSVAHASCSVLTTV